MWYVFELFIVFLLCVFFFFFFFFFSSRRRHTRSLRDWSSDVCSSDLALDRAVVGPRHLAQAVADTSDALVVMRFHGRSRPEHRPEPRAVVDLHSVVGERSLHHPMLLAADDLGQVLHEIAAARDIQDLETAADRE